MEYRINHVHIRSSGPRNSAEWQERHFDAKLVSGREVMPDTITVSMEVGGPVRLNISSRPSGLSDERAVAELNRTTVRFRGSTCHGKWLSAAIQSQKKSAPT